MSADPRYKCPKCGYTGWDKNECRCGSRQLIELIDDDTQVNTDFKIDPRELARVAMERKRLQAVLNS
jgi:hypothetical protein